MWVYPRFPGDNNEVYNKVQHDLYERLCYDIFEKARKFWITAALTLGLERTVIEEVMNVQSIDHRRVQIAYDGLATCYRFIRRDNNIGLGFDKRDIIDIVRFFKPEGIDITKYNFNEVELGIAYDWYHYYSQQLDRLCEQSGSRWNEDNSFVSCVIKAVVLRKDAKDGSNAEWECERIIYKSMGSSFVEMCQKYLERNLSKK